MNPNEKLIRPGLWAPQKNLAETKRRLRAKVPKPKDYELKARWYYEVILNFLYYNGFEKSAKLVEELINMEIESVKFYKTPPYLTSSNKSLTELAETLKDIEMGNSTPMVLVKFAMGLTQSKYQRWIALILLDYALKLAMAIKYDEGYLEAQVRYVIAQMMLEDGKLSEASRVLIIAHDLAFEKSWNTVNINRNLFKDINYLQFLLFAKAAEELKKDSLLEAIELSKEAVKHSFNSDMKFALPKALLLRGSLEADNGEYLTALGFLNQVVQYAQMANMQDLICKANLQKALCLYKSVGECMAMLFKCCQEDRRGIVEWQFQSAVIRIRMEGQTNRALAFIHLAKRRAHEKRLSLYVGKSFMMMGTLNMTRKQFDTAGANYLEALEEFIRTGDHEWIIHAKCKAGYALVCAVMEIYYELIIQTTKDVGDNNLKRLLLWKDKRIPFWTKFENKFIILEGEVGFYDEYETEKISLLDGQVVFNLDLLKKISPWRKSAYLPFSKHFVGYYTRVYHCVFVAL